MAAVTTAASRSDLGSQSAADHVRGFGKELGTFAKHVAGEDLARRDDATTSANDEGSISKRDATRDDDRDDRDDLWSAFGAMAKHAAKSLETVAVAVASDPNVTRVASRSAAAAKRAVAAAETRAFDFLERTLGERSEESRVFAAIADADGVLLERALIERGCAAHLESLETLADAADAFAEERSDRLESEKEENHATSARSAFRADALASADAALDVERNREIETSDGDTTVDIARAGGPVPGEDASELTGAMRADAEAAARNSAAAALAAFSDALRAREGLETPSETPSFPSPESIEAALRTSLEPTRRQSAARVADVTAAVVAHLVDVAAALQTSPGELEEATGASGTVARAWPSPASTASPGAHGDTTPASIAIARARLIGARVRAMAADADGVADAFAAATVAAFSNASENDLASFFADAEAFAAFLVSVEKHATNTAARLKEVSMGYAADAARCLRAVVAASAEDAATAAR